MRDLQVKGKCSGQGPAPELIARSAGLTASGARKSQGVDLFQLLRPLAANRFLAPIIPLSLRNEGVKNRRAQNSWSLEFLSVDRLSFNGLDEK
ncbi:MAG: hypothetical protein JSW39_26290 [Desulfobacterales bacterium]|nr:MAG: hypothetical protein JSW39_26290 [Desulfobacterales bacterium]